MTPTTQPPVSSHGQIAATSGSCEPGFVHQSDPHDLSRTTVSVSAAYDADDGRVKWEVDASDDRLIHISLIELKYVGQPFDCELTRQVFSIMVTREQAVALGHQLRVAVLNGECK